VNVLPNTPIPLILLAEMFGCPIGSLRSLIRERKVRRRDGSFLTYPKRINTYKINGLVMVAPEEVKRLIEENVLILK